MIRTKFAAVCIVLFLAGIASALPTGSVDLGNYNFAMSGQANLWGGGTSGGRYYTGIISWTTSSASGDGSLVPDWGFCIDLTQGASNASYVVDSQIENYSQPAAYTTPMGTERANNLRELWGRYFDPTWVTNATQENRNLAGAFGVAIWEIIYETDTDQSGNLVYDITSGSGFRASSLSGAMEGQANQWLMSLDGSGLLADNLLALSSQTSQDFISVPEPATVGLLGLGLMFLIRRRRGKS